MLASERTAGRRIEPTATFPSRKKIAGHYVYLTKSPAARLAAVRAGFGIGVLSHHRAYLKLGARIRYFLIGRCPKLIENVSR